MKGQRFDFFVYLQALPLLFRHPAILAVPLLAAVIDLLVSAVSPLMTDPVGGIGAGILQMLVQIVYLFAFGVAVIYASDVLRGRKATFDSVWEEARGKAGGIVIAAIGFQFIIYVAQMIGGIAGEYGQLALQLIAYFFLLFTIPAAAIGGLPGGLAISGSIRAVRANVASSIVLAVVFVALWVFLPGVLTTNLLLGLSPIVYQLVIAAIRAVLLGYLAFPFAKLYDEAAFRGLR